MHRFIPVKLEFLAGFNVKQAEGEKSGHQAEIN
jgi:hypothetical protein